VNDAEKAAWLQSRTERKRLRWVWHEMHRRCRDVKHKQYADYGGRGITVCERWANFDAFLADMGARPEGMSVDRVNNNGPYSPKNCRWADRVTQNNNRRYCRRIAWGVETMTAKEFCRATGMKYRPFVKRIERGWSMLQIFANPIWERS
jgi:hypothetical protein